MKNRSLYSAIKFLCLTLLMFEGNLVYAQCNYEAYKKDYFSSDKTKDTLYSRIEGKDCASATQTISIENSDKVELYKHREKLRCHDGNGNVAKQDVMRCLNWELSEPVFGESKSMVSIESIKSNPLDNPVDLSVSEEKYRYYREKNWKTFTHSIGYESGITVIYDRDKGSVVKVSIFSP